MAKNNSTIDRIQAVWNKLGGEIGVDKLLRGDLVVLRHKGNQVIAQVEPLRIRVWLGECKTRDEYKARLAELGMQIGLWGGPPLFRKLECSGKRVGYELIALSVRDLGFDEKTEYRQICEAAFALGLELCPAECGPALRLEYPDQPKGQTLYVAMEAIAVDGDDDTLIWEVKNTQDGTLELDGYSGNPDMAWKPEVCFVFVRRKL